MAELRARDVMQPHPAVIQQSASLREALERLYQLHVRHLPVLDHTRLVGMLSDRDIREVATPALAPAESARMLDMPVARMMSTDVVTAAPGTDVGELVDLILDNEIGALPILADEKVLVGIVSYVDILRALRPTLAP